MVAPAATTTVDIDFIYLLVILAVAAMLVGLLLGYRIIKRTIGDPAQQLLKSKGKAQSFMLQLAPNNLWRMVPVLKKFGNRWFTADGSITVTTDHVHSLVGAFPTVIENTVASDPNDAFARYAGQLAANSSKPPKITEIVTYLTKRKQALSDLTESIQNLKDGKSIQEVTEQMMTKRKIPLVDPIAYQAIAQRLWAGYKSGGQEYVQELARVNEALKITKDERPFEFVTDEMGDVIDVVSKETITVDDFIALTPAGTVQDVQTVAQRNEAVAVKESQFSMNQAMKYLVIGVVVFIALVGAAYFFKTVF
jgi:hypothetical protein